MKPYSKDLRLRVLAAVDRGMPKREAARIFGVSEPTIRRYLRLRRETGNVEPKPVPGPPARKWEALEQRLPAQVHLNPDLTLEEHCKLFEEESGMVVFRLHHEPRLQEEAGAAAQKSRSGLPSETKRRGLAGEKRLGR